MVEPSPTPTTKDHEMSKLDLLPCPHCGGPAKLGAPGFSNSKVVCAANYCCEAVSVTVWNRRTAQEQGWQPIATAPKDTCVLVTYLNPLGNRRIVVGCYHTHLDWSDAEAGMHEEEFAPVGWYEESETNETIWPTGGKPTHWRPLPAAPTPGGEE